MLIVCAGQINVKAETNETVERKKPAFTLVSCLISLK
jgi:hypothetical protein